MRKKQALFVALLVTLVVLGNYLFFGDIFPEREIVLVARVIDGDTIELDDGRKIRLLNINAPEKGRAFSDEATNFLKQYEGKTIEMETAGVGAYGRILGKLYDENYLNLELVEKGLAHKYLVEDGEIENYEEAERKAREGNKGLWQESEKTGCLSAEINKKEEIVLIKNKCGDLKDWEIKDESTKSYFFESVSEEEIEFYSEEGIDGEGKIYWGRGKAWNDDKDSIFIRDSEGLLVFYDNYGY